MDDSATDRFDPDLADLEKAGAGDRAAFARIVDRHLGAIVTLAERMTGNRSDAQDVAQDVMLRAWRQASTWRSGQARFSTWLHRVALNACIDRARRPRAVPLDEAADVPSAEPGVESQLHRRDVERRVRAALAQLPERQRAALVLSHYRELSNVEAAAVLEISVDALESLLSRGRRALRALLAPEAETLSGDLP